MEEAPAWVQAPAPSSTKPSSLGASWAKLTSDPSDSASRASGCFWPAPGPASNCSRSS